MHAGAVAYSLGATWCEPMRRLALQHADYTITPLLNSGQVDMSNG